MEKITKIEDVEVKGKVIKVELTYYYDKDNDLLYDDIELGNYNLRRIRNAYRKETGLLTDDEIKEIRGKYFLNQRNFALLLGFGEVTITRYESKSIQEKAHDDIIRKASDPNTFLEYVEKNKDAYLKYNSLDTYNVLLTTIKNMISNSFKDSGNVAYDSEKFHAAISYILSKMKSVKKTKLVKYLWYADFYSYKKYNHSITGLTYVHNHYGAYPLGLNDKLSNNAITIIDNYCDANDSYEYIITSCNSKVELSKEEKEIIDTVLEKLGKYNTKELVEYMHKEDAYLHTNQNEIISYDYAKTLSI